MQLLTLSAAARQLNLSEALTTKLVIDAGLDPDNLTEVDIAQLKAEVRNRQNSSAKALRSANSSNNLPSESQPSSNPEDLNLDYIDWTEALEQLSEQGIEKDLALAVVQELSLNPKALSQSDLSVVQELALSDAVQKELKLSARSLHDVQVGGVEEAVLMAVEEGQRLGQLTGMSKVQAALRSRLQVEEMGYQAFSSIHAATCGEITNQMAALGNLLQPEGNDTPQDVNRPEEITKRMGEKSMNRRDTAERQQKARQSRLGNWLN